VRAGALGAAVGRKRIGGGPLLLGGVALVSASAFGSRALGVAGIGLLLAGALGRVWAILARSRAWGVVSVDPLPATEGDAVRLIVEARRGTRVPVGCATLRARIGRLGEVDCRLAGHGSTASGEISLGRPPRGRFRVSDAVLELGDPLGLESVAIRLELLTAVVVQPRLVELRTLFSDAGRLGSDGRRLLLRRHAGFDFHSVRTYEQGESLRRVHWPTTARRGELMVKELEEAPHDVVAVLLDCDPAGSSGTPPDASFDAAVRAAGSIMRAYSERGRRATLVTTGSERATVDIGSLAADFGAVLAALAAAEADAPHPLYRMLDGTRSSVSVAGELVVVTSVLDARTVNRLLEAASKHVLSVVWVDAPSFSGRPTRAAAGVLRLTAAGIPAAVVRHGDDLGAALSAPRVESRARA
jgi:uncharacterized protein (DUF58 family)